MGSAQPDETSEGSYDLFDRWLAHRQTGVDPGAGAAAEPDPVGPEADPLFDEAFVASHDEELALEPDNPPELLSPTPESPASPPAAESRPTDHDAARAVLAAFAAQAEPEQAAPPAAMREPAVLRDAEAVTRPVEPRAEVTAEPLPATAAAPAPGPVTTPATDPQHEPDHDVLPPVVEFAPRTGTRRLVGVVLLLCLAATAVAAYSAYLAPTTAAIGIAGTLGVLTLVVWAVRASTAPAQVTVRGGQVEIVRAGSRHRFDLASHYTPVDVIGEPGDRSWKVLFHRRSMTPFVVDASMVDPAEFTRVLRRYRPERD